MWSSHLRNNASTGGWYSEILRWVPLQKQEHKTIQCFWIQLIVLMPHKFWNGWHHVALLPRRCFSLEWLWTPMSGFFATPNVDWTWENLNWLLTQSDIQVRLWIHCQSPETLQQSKVGGGGELRKAYLDTKNPDKCWRKWQRCQKPFGIPLLLLCLGFCKSWKIPTGIHTFERMAPSNTYSGFWLNSLGWWTEHLISPAWLTNVTNTSLVWRLKRQQTMLLGGCRMT